MGNRDSFDWTFQFFLLRSEMGEIVIGSGLSRPPFYGDKKKESIGSLSFFCHQQIDRNVMNSDTSMSVSNSSATRPLISGSKSQNSKLEFSMVDSILTIGSSFRWSSAM